MSQDFEALKEAVRLMNESTKSLVRASSLMMMSLPNHPYRPLIRVMAKLELIKDWPTW